MQFTNFLTKSLIGFPPFHPPPPPQKKNSNRKTPYVTAPKVAAHNVEPVRESELSGAPGGRERCVPLLLLLC